MSRSDYQDDPDNWALIRWRGAVESAKRGKRGQALLREMAAALDAMEVKVLIKRKLAADGNYCALGVVGAARGLDMAQIDTEDRDEVASAFDIADALACEVMYENDHGGPPSESPEWRWRRMRRWVAENLAEEKPC